ncbi:C4-dicarboxylate ABC transporter [Nitrosomonas sp. JL21]|uniref:C4-dicarboxylate ABC transporter n=1 Tax=Nitrosomonas sp. JL21 TaxID=153949 RepID=UPI00136EB193|nr:C4-dicarboxylate ABC transporter [Nitrosomonas sp. JL21]MBL8496285.1 C4-dicarboxylate ABC transporter [Nitrosomonas sp.]MCC7091000.1 C4-dicarboxylate ABC transporter [Nitrosomonas sp.]MXS76948.1 C4-dicarboxylate ABC transporter [Nitrosomonas sp. JL21]
MTTKQVFIISATAIGITLIGLLSMFELTHYLMNWLITDGKLGLSLFVLYLLSAVKFEAPRTSIYRTYYLSAYRPSTN